MAANYNRTKPCDPLEYRMDRHLRISCPCGHRRTVRIGDLVRMNKLDKRQAIYQVAARFRCGLCGRRDPVIEPIR